MTTEFTCDDLVSGLDVESAGQRRGLPAWVLSLLLHLLLMVLLGLLPTTPRPSAASPGTRRAGIALVVPDRATTAYFSEDDLLSPTATAAGPTSARPATALPRARQLPVDPALALDDAPRATAGGVSAMPRVEGFTSTGRATSFAGDQTRTGVFGAEATGSKFVYVFDRSASMDGFQGRPMAAARRALWTSLGDLTSVHQFQIVFYNDRASVFNPYRPQPPRMMFATEENKQLADEFIRGVVPAGATRHLEALRLAIGMRPDAIFFLTDAAEPQLSPGDLADLRRRSGGTVINAIEFGAGPASRAENFLTRLARQNGGQYVYVDVTQLGP